MGQIKIIWGPFDGNQGSGSGQNQLYYSDQLILGGVGFLDEEAPNDLAFKLNEVLAVHTLIGGTRTIQDLGPSMEDVTWHGQLFASNVGFRIDQLHSMQTTAQPVKLSYLGYSFQVLIKTFQWKFLHKYRAEYEITVTILEDTSGVYSFNGPSGIGQQITGISAATKALIAKIVAQDQAGFTAALAACNVMFFTIEAAGIISQLSGPELQALVQSIAAAIIAVEEYRAGLG